MNTLSAKLLYWLALIISYGSFLYYVQPYLSMDLTWDEVHTLRHLVFKSAPYIATKYDNPNNHIFFSLALHGYVSLIGLEKFWTVVEQPWLLRSFSLALGLATLLLTQAIATHLYGRLAGVCTIALLTTHQLFFMYAYRLRGYILSCFLITLLGYVLFVAARRASAQRYIVLTLLTAATFYTIPSNLYGLLALGLVLFGDWLGSVIKTKTYAVAAQLKLPIFQDMCAMCTGMLFGTLCYLPVIDNVMNNRYVQVHKTRDVSAVFDKFIASSFSPLTILAMIICGWLLARMLARSATLTQNSVVLKRIVTVLIIAFLPFFFSYLRGDRPFNRTFITSTIPLAIGISGIISLLLSSLKCTQVRANFVVLALVVVAIVTFQATSIAEEQRNLETIQRLQSTTRISRNRDNIGWAPSYFNPCRFAEEFKKEVYHKGVPVYLIKPHDPPATGICLESQQIETREAVELSSLSGEGPRVFAIITLYPEYVQSQLGTIKCSRYSKDWNASVLLICSR